MMLITPLQEMFQFGYEGMSLGSAIEFSGVNEGLTVSEGIDETGAAYSTTYYSQTIMGGGSIVWSLSANTTVTTQGPGRWIRNEQALDEELAEVGTEVALERWLAHMPEEYSGPLADTILDAGLSPVSRGFLLKAVPLVGAVSTVASAGSYISSDVWGNAGGEAALEHGIGGAASAGATIVVEGALTSVTELSWATGVGFVAASAELGWAAGSAARQYMMPDWANRDYGDAELWAVEKFGYRP